MTGLKGPAFGKPSPFGNGAFGSGSSFGGGTPPAPPSNSVLLIESGFALLLEDGNKILLET